MIRPRFDKKMTVFGRGGSSTRYDTAVKTDLECLVGYLSTQPPATAAERAEAMSIRVFMWDAAYSMPENCRVKLTHRKVAGEWQVLSGEPKWVPRPGTFAAPEGYSGQTSHRRAEFAREGS